MFKVLIIAYYFPPKGLSGVQRTLKFVKYMPQNNWKPIVITSELNTYYAYDETLMDDLKNEQIEIHRVGGNEINSLLGKKKAVSMPPEFIRKLLSYISSFFFIPDNKKGWAKKAYPVARDILKNQKVDVIFVTGPPFSSVSLAMKLKEEFQIPFTIDYRDLWFGNQFASYPTPIHKSIVKRQEYRALKVADKVFVTNRRIKEKLMEYYKFISFRDIIIIPHGFDPEDIEKVQPEERTNNKMIVTYTGAFYEYITPKYFLAAFKKLTMEHPDIAGNIELHFVGIIRKGILKNINKLELQRFVKIFGYLDHLSTIKRMKSSDLLWLMVGRGRNSDTISSGKLFEYFGVEKPILGCLHEGALKSALEEYGAGYIVEPDDINGIKNLLITIYEDFRLGKMASSNKEIVQKYRRDYLTEQLTKELQFLIKVRQ